MGKPYFLALLAEAYTRVDQIKAGLEVLAEGLMAAYATGELYYGAELYRLKGTLLLAQAPENQVEAEHCFRQATRNKVQYRVTRLLPRCSIPEDILSALLQHCRESF